MNLTYDSLSRVLTEVQGSDPLGAALRTRHASRKRNSEGRATNRKFVRPRSGGDTLQFRPSGCGPLAGRSRVAGRAKLKDVPTCNRLTTVLRDVNDPGAEYACDALGLGRRIRKVAGSDTTRCVRAVQQAIEEWGGTGSGASLRRLYVFDERIDHLNPSWQDRLEQHSIGSAYPRTGEASDDAVLAAAEAATCHHEMRHARHRGSVYERPRDDGLLKSHICGPQVGPSPTRGEAMDLAKAEVDALLNAYLTELDAENARRGKKAEDAYTMWEELRPTTTGRLPLVLYGTHK